MSYPKNANMPHTSKHTGTKQILCINDHIYSSNRMAKSSAAPENLFFFNQLIFSGCLYRQLLLIIDIHTQSCLDTNINPMQ